MGRSRRTRLILRPRADLDVDHHFEYLAIEGDIATARQFLRNLRKTVGALRKHPEMGSPRVFADARLAGLRMWPVQGFRRHLVFYIPRQEAIEVLRVLHGARDLESLLIGGR